MENINKLFQSKITTLRAKIRCYKRIRIAGIIFVLVGLTLVVSQSSANYIRKKPIGSMMNGDIQYLQQPEKSTANIIPDNYGLYLDRVLGQPKITTNKLLLNILSKSQENNENPCPGKGCPDPMGSLVPSRFK